MVADPIEVLVENIAEVLLRAGKTHDEAYTEAESITSKVLDELYQTGAQVGHLLRRVRVYELRISGLSIAVVMQRVGVSRTGAHRMYKKELLRRRYAA